MNDSGLIIGTLIIVFCFAFLGYVTIKEFSGASKEKQD